jgi:hypothetical protein
MNTLTKDELYRIVDTVPSITDRAKLLSHLVVTGSCLPARPVRDKARVLSPKAIAEAIDTWARGKWKESSVRAKTVSTVLIAIESGEVKL